MKSAEEKKKRNQERKDLILDLVEKVNTLGQEINSYRECPRHYGDDTGSLKDVEIRLLHKVGENGDLGNKELAKGLSRTKGAISIMVTRLESEGYLVKTIDPQDSRKQILQLTERGRMVYDAHNAVIDEYYTRLAECLGDYSPKDISKCVQLIQSIIDYWTK